MGGCRLWILRVPFFYKVCNFSFVFFFIAQLDFIWVGESETTFLDIEVNGFYSLSINSIFYLFVFPFTLVTFLLSDLNGLPNTINVTCQGNIEYWIGRGYVRYDRAFEHISHKLRGYIYNNRVKIKREFEWRKSIPIICALIFQN